MTDLSPIPFVDLKAQFSAYRTAIEEGIQAVLEHGGFIMGPEVKQLEASLSEFCGVKHTISCSSGTDALLMIMMAEGIGPGDAVFVPAFTFTATAEAILLLGASPVFVDVESDSFNIDVADLERQLATVTSAGGLKPRGILAVDLFGQPANYPALNILAESHGLKVWSDAAQSFGGALGNKSVGSLARATATSFFPAKPLGCYGDGGAVFTDDDELAEKMRSIRAHGKGTAKYDIVRIGLNARLDTIQAAVLLAKLPHFSDEIAAREAVAKRYDEGLSNIVAVPSRAPEAQSAWAQYTIKLPAERRDKVSAALKSDGIPTAVYYPRSMHLQSAYREYGAGENSMPVSERLSTEVLSLPMHPFLSNDECDRIIAALVSVGNG